MNKLRQKLESRAFPDLGGMMEGYAHAAVEVARSEFRQKLDFSADSINALDEILVLLSESPEIDLDYESRLWGSYLGEVLRQRYAGSWEMTQYSGGRARDARRGCTRLTAVSADEGVSPPDRWGRGRLAKLLRDGDGAAGQSSTGELSVHRVNATRRSRHEWHRSHRAVGFVRQYRV